MKKIYLFIAFAMVLAASASCSKEQNPPVVNKSTLSLTLGFENQSDQSAEGNDPDTKLFLSGYTVKWGSPNNDKVIYVFDNNDVKHVFTSTENTASATRTFSAEEGDNIQSQDIKYVVWTGKTSNSDASTVSGDIISGLSLTDNQTINNANSFNANVNFVVMKPGDSSLRNVFGYIKFTVPKAADNDYAAIKSVKFEADEYLSGDVQIDYSGTDPVATVVSNGKKYVTVTTRFKSGYEPGTYYAVVPAGTYHNFKLIITPFSEAASAQGAATGTSFSVKTKTDVIVQRGKMTSIGNTTTGLPYADTRWPQSTDAFDYGLGAEESRKSSFTGGADAGFVNQQSTTEAITLNDVTYGSDVTYYGNRVTVNRATAWNTEYPNNIIPSSRYISFKINKPGSIKFYVCPSSKDGDVMRVPTYYLAVITKVNGVTSAKIVQTFTPTVYADGSKSENRNESNIYTAGWEQYWVSLPITKDDLAGIDEAATVYLYHRYTANCQVHYFPFFWTAE